MEPKNYVDVTRRWLAEHMSFPLNFLLPGRMQSRQLDKLRLLRGDHSLEAGDQLEKEVCVCVRVCTEFPCVSSSGWKKLSVEVPKENCCCGIICGKGQRSPVELIGSPDGL